jgi:hypothetical protein
MLSQEEEMTEVKEACCRNIIKHDLYGGDKTGGL